MRGERFNTVFEALYDDPAKAAEMQARAEAIIAREQAEAIARTRPAPSPSTSEAPAAPPGARSKS
jgi:hypothetical protein